MSRAIRFECDHFGCTRWINIRPEPANDTWADTIAEACGWTRDRYGDDLCPTHTLWAHTATRIAEGVA